MNDFDCLDCIRPIQLTKNGRCPYCDGNAVAPATGTNWKFTSIQEIDEIAKLERMFEL